MEINIKNIENFINAGQQIIFFFLEVVNGDFYIKKY